ncbi:MAG TPA: transketolase C-terminal domain-containing protein [Chloroflexota bacterium]
MVVMRIAYGQALAEYGAENENVVVLDADVSASTQSHFFASKFPHRFFNVGIAEAGMVDAAVGLALGGKVPFVNTFAFLLAFRAAEQIRTCVAYSKVPVKLAAHYAGLSDSFDGPTHQSVSDVAVMRGLPEMTVVIPADATEARMAVKAAAEYPGPVYLRLCRNEVPTLFGAEHPFQIGKGITLRDGGDVTVAATGVMVARALEAADELAKLGIQARVLDLHTVKPLDTDLVLRAAAETGCLVTAEEHSVIGGLGGAVAELLGEENPVPVVRVGIRDRFAETGPYPALMERYHLEVTDIVAAAKKALGMRKERTP